MLHTVNKSPFSSNLLEECLRFAGKKDPILLYEDGVYAAMANSAKLGLLKEAMKDHAVYALQADVKARGISLAEGVSLVDYAGFVDLVAEHKVTNWY